MAEHFSISDTNPNDTCGGGGCLCSEITDPDREGPFVVFHHQEMASNISPHAVVCANCVRSAAGKLEGEILSAGERIPEDVPEVETTSDPQVGDPEAVPDV